MDKSTQKKRKRRISALLIWSMLLILPLSCAKVKSPEQTAAELRDNWGIEITQLNLTANDYMVGFRYRVIDAEKSKEIFNRQKKPYLVDQASGKAIAVPNIGKVGPLRTSDPPQEGRIYWMFFNNLSGIIQHGSKVTIVIGDFKVEDLVVL